MKTPEGPLTALTITTVIDAYVDMFAPSTELVRRAELGHTAAPLQGGHGSSFLVDCRHEDGAISLLIDGGLSPRMLGGNLEALGRRPEEIGGLVLTHGHPDHYQGFWGILPELSPGRPIYLHPGAFTPRMVRNPRGQGGTWVLDRAALKAQGLEIVETADWLSLGGSVHLSGNLPEDAIPLADLPGTYSLAGGEWSPDRVADEMAVVFDLGHRGLVLLSACSHRWLPAVARYVSGRLHKKVAGLIAGLHLSRAPIDVMKKMARELAALELQFVVSGHCTGFEASAVLRDVLGERFVMNTVGARLVLLSGGEDDPEKPYPAADPGSTPGR